MSGRKKLLVVLWSAFGLLWAFLAKESATNPTWAPGGVPVLLIFEIGMVAYCGAMVVRLIRAPDA